MTTQAVPERVQATQRAAFGNIDIFTRRGGGESALMAKSIFAEAPIRVAARRGND
ncbi:hypothetical protein GCM10023094_31160 [Rhodococcus olei]|uniref:Uncharacterized protein n=1 Tax=Rhodococcus olei TaxID=2161675 RepID=A0ABP8P884_9NOCA